MDAISVLWSSLGARIAKLEKPQLNVLFVVRSFRRFSIIYSRNLVCLVNLLHSSMMLKLIAFLVERLLSAVRPAQLGKSPLFVMLVPKT